MPTFRENLHLGTHDPLITTDDLACDSVGPCQIQDDAVSLEKLTPGVRSIFTNLVNGLAAEAEDRKQADLDLQNDVRTIQQKMVRSISVNNGAPILPDSSGNIHLHFRSGEGDDPDDLTPIYGRLDALEAKPAIVTFWQEEEPSTEDLPANTLWYDTENAVLKVLVTPEGSSPFWATVSQPSEGFYVFYESSEGESIPHLYFCKDGELSPFPTGGGPTPNVEQEWQSANPTDIVSKQAINSQLTAIRQEMTDIAGGDVTFGTYTGKILIPTPEEYDETKVKTYLNPGDFIINKAPEDITAEDVLAYHIDEIPYTELEVVDASDILQASETYDDTIATSNTAALIDYLDEYRSVKVVRLGSNMFPLKVGAYTSDGEDYTTYTNGNAIVLDRDMRFVGDVDENGKAAGGFLTNVSFLFYTEHSLELENVHIVLLSNYDSNYVTHSYPVFLNPCNEGGIDHLIVRNCILESQNAKRVWAWFHVCRGVHSVIEGGVRTVTDDPYKTDDNFIIDNINCFRHILIENTSCQHQLIGATYGYYENGEGKNSGATLVTHSCRFVNNTITNLVTMGIGLGTGNEGTYNSTVGFANCPIWIVGCSFYGRAIDGSLSLFRSNSANYRGGALVEASRLYFLRNKVIDFFAAGDKFGNTIAQYDVYFQGREIFFVNNEIKNLVRMTGTTELGGTLKGKGTCTPYDVLPYTTPDFDYAVFNNGSYVGCYESKQSGDDITNYRHLKTTAVAKTALPYARYYTNNKYVCEEDVVKDAWNNRSQVFPIDYTYFVKSTRAKYYRSLSYWSTTPITANSSNVGQYWWNGSDLQYCKATTVNNVTTYSWAPASSDKQYFYFTPQGESETLFLYQGGNLTQCDMNQLADKYNEEFVPNIDEWLCLTLGVYDAPTADTSGVTLQAVGAEHKKLVFNHNYIDYPAISGPSSGHQHPVGVCEVIGNYFKTKYIPAKEYCPAPERVENYTESNVVQRYLFAVAWTEILKFNDNVITAQPPTGSNAWTVNTIIYRYRSESRTTDKYAHWDSIRPDHPDKVCEMRDNAFDAKNAANKTSLRMMKVMLGGSAVQMYPFTGDVATSGGGGGITIEDVDEHLYPGSGGQSEIIPTYSDCTIAQVRDMHPNAAQGDILEDSVTHNYYQLTQKGSLAKIGLLVTDNIYNTYTSAADTSSTLYGTIAIKYNGVILKQCTLPEGVTYENGDQLRRAINTGLRGATYNPENGKTLFIPTTRNMAVEFSGCTLEMDMHGTPGADHIINSDGSTTRIRLNSNGWVTGAEDSWELIGSSSTADFSGSFNDRTGLAPDVIRVTKTGQSHGTTFLDTDSGQTYECVNLGVSARVPLVVHRGVGANNIHGHLSLRTSGGKLIAQCDIPDSNYADGQALANAVAQAFRDAGYSVSLPSGEVTMYITSLEGVCIDYSTDVGRYILNADCSQLSGSFAAGTKEYASISDIIEGSSTNLVNGVDSVWEKVSPEGVGHKVTSLEKVVDTLQRQVAFYREQIGTDHRLFKAWYNELQLFTEDFNVKGDYNLFFDGGTFYNYGLINATNTWKYKKGSSFLSLPELLQKLDKLTTAPASPATGDIYIAFDATTGNPKLKYYNGSSWQDFSVS